MPAFSRRSLFAAAAAVSLMPVLGLPRGSAAAEPVEFGQPYPFDFDRLRARAEALASRVYEPPRVRVPEILEDLGYLAHRDIAYRPEFEVWAQGPYPIRLFHLGRHFKVPVNVHIVEDDQAREILYSPRMFAFGERAAFASALPADLGFAGFRVMAGEGEADWLAFLGAAYFRSSGELGQYGLSARGIAVGTGLPEPEEFPRFTSFWLEAVPGRPETLTVYALMDGPSIAGAFRMVWDRKRGVSADVQAALYVRKDIVRMGIAPLTSMFWFGENSRHLATDWRPEVHDSDGLAIWTGAGERIWRPLYNPPSVQTNSFVDSTPKGFGLLQRERDFDRYQDDRRHYDRRPTVWVEPLGDWGEGAVQLVELPTGNEINDNIVAYWTPKRPATAGSELTFDYRLHWVKDEPFGAEIGRVIATRTGRAGPPSRRPATGAYRFVVDFAGGPLDRLAKDDPVQATIRASRGTIDRKRVAPIADTRIWRVFFDLTVDGTDPVDLRLFLHRDAQALTETWMFQYPPREA